MSLVPLTESSIYSSKFHELLPQFVLDLSHLCHHINLYNELGFKLIDYFHDDEKYEEYVTHLPTKPEIERIKSYKASLRFEFFLKDAKREEKSGNYVISIDYLVERYPNMTPFWIAKRLVEENALPLKEDSAIFAALIQRVRISLALPNYSTRLAVGQTLIYAQACYCNEKFSLMT